VFNIWNLLLGLEIDSSSQNSKTKRKCAQDLKTEQEQTLLSFCVGILNRTKILVGPRISGTGRFELYLLWMASRELFVVRRMFNKWFSCRFQWGT